MSLISGTVGAVLGSDATESAANTAAAATKDAATISAEAQQKALEFQKQAYEETQKRWEPYRAFGERGLSAMDKLLYGGYDMRESPSAQYALTQGTRALSRQLAARGNLGGGTAAQRLGELSSGIAASDYNTRYNQLLNAIQTGTGAVAGTGAAGTTLGGQMQAGASNLGNIATGAGNTLADIAMIKGQQTASLYSGLGGASANTASAALKGYDLYNKYNAAGSAGGGYVSGQTGEALAL